MLGNGAGRLLQVPTFDFHGKDAVKDGRPAGSKFGSRSDKASLARVFTRVGRERYSLACTCDCRERGDRFLAPLGHHLLVAQTDPQVEQLARVCWRRRAVGEAHLDDAIIALVTVAMMFEPRRK